MKESHRPSFISKEAGTTGGFLLIKHAESLTSVLKTAYASEEFSGYQLMQDHYPTIATRLISHEGENALLMPFVPSRTPNDLIDEENSLATEVFDAFLEDSIGMWEVSAEAFDPLALKRDYAEISVDGLEAIATSAAERLALGPDQEFTLQGTEGTFTINEMSRLWRECLVQQPQSMVLAHGDENFGNVLLPQGADNGADYRVIDARFAGYYDKAWVLANMYARPYLFNADFPDEIERYEAGNQVYFDSFSPKMPSSVEIIQRRLREYVQGEKINDPTLHLRMAAFAAQNTARSIAYLRDNSFRTANDRYGRQHYLQGIADFCAIVQW